MEEKLSVDVAMRRIQEVVAKETPIPVKIKSGKGLFEDTCYAACPTCEFQADPSWNYCPKCGQAISW